MSNTINLLILIHFLKIICVEKSIAINNYSIYSKIQIINNKINKLLKNIKSNCKILVKLLD
jgi:hypothetical protein